MDVASTLVARSGGARRDVGFRCRPLHGWDTTLATITWISLRPPRFEQPPLASRNIVGLPPQQLGPGVSTADLPLPMHQCPVGITSTCVASLSLAARSQPYCTGFIPGDSRGYRWRADRQNDDTDQLATGDERLAPADHPVVQRLDDTGPHDGDVGSRHRQLERWVSLEADTSSLVLPTC